MKLKIEILGTVIILITSVLSCRQSQTNQKQTDSDALLEVIYFHTSMRCPACIAIENITKKVLDDNYKTQIDSGIIKFTSCNIDEKLNKSIVEKYQVSYLTLLIIQADGTNTDVTNVALKYAEFNPDKFIELLKAEIDKNLK